MSFNTALQCGFVTTHAQDRNARHARALAAWRAGGEEGPKPPPPPPVTELDPKFVTFSVHHICENSQRQDTAAVLTSLEALLRKLKRLMGDKLKGVTISSDNAAYYKCDAMIPLLVCMSKAIGVKILRVVNPAPQDGKS